MILYIPLVWILHELNAPTWVGVVTFVALILDTAIDLLKHGGDR